MLSASPVYVSSDGKETNKGILPGNDRVIIYFAVAGPTSSVTVPIELAASLHSSFSSETSGDAVASREVDRNLTQNYHSSIGVCSGSCFPGQVANYIGVYDDKIESNSIMRLIFRSQIDLNNIGTAFASGDPVVFIDPTILADNPGYGLGFSAGFDNEAGPVSAVPLTGAASLMTLTLIGVGCVAGYRRSLQDHSRAAAFPITIAVS